VGTNPIADIYAEALLRGLEERSRRPVLEELRAVFECMGDMNRIREFLACPRAGHAERREFLETLLRHCPVSERTGHFLTLVLDAGRLVHLGDIIDAFEEGVMKSEHRVKAEVASAVPLEPAERDALVDYLEKRTGKTIDLRATVEPGMIAGMRVRVGSMLWDGSLEKQLERLEGRMSVASSEND
jgi:F-type H+-transporting ATPase subunit delta